MVQKGIRCSSIGKITAFVLICFFFSGVAGLIYEILWTRMIVKIIGGAPFAISIILTIFMGGLGLGSYLAGRTIDRIEKPAELVKIYGLLELAIGAYGLALPVLLIAFRPIYAVIYNRLFEHFMLFNLITFIGCFILLCLPVICMGATLPVLCRFYVSKLSHLGTHAGRLYGLNTIGAALGALVCGFWLINLLGMWGTLIFAVAVNGLIGLSCLLVFSRTEKPEPCTIPAVVGTEEALLEKAQHVHASWYTAAANAALVIFAVSGFCAIAYEVIWTKLLGLIVGPTTYSFTIVLVTFILGLALGSMLFGWLGDKTNKPIWLLIYSQVAAALLVLVISQILGDSQFFFSKLIFSFKDNFVLLSLSKAVILFAFMIFPTLCLGATFPLVGKIYTQSVSRVGRSIGFAYAVNTIGAVLGSFCAGFVLIPLLGKEKSLSLVIGLQLVTSLLVGVIILVKKKKSILKWVPLVAPSAAALLLCFYFPRWNRILFSQGKYQRFHQIEADIKNTGWVKALLRGPEILARTEKGKLVYYGDGVGGFTTVMEYSDPFGNIDYALANSGKTDATSHEDMKTQTLSAHFPMLFHENPKTVLVIGLASGITAGETLYYPVEQLDVVEINRQVVAASEFFIPWNNSVLSSPRTNLIVQDGRMHLQLTGKKYDVIISEPSNPWMAGLAALFTREFFTLAMDRLNADGIFVQWIQSYEMDWSTFALVGRTFASVFPNSILVSSNPSGPQDYLLIGFKGTDELSLENAKQKLDFINRSKNVILPDARLLYRLIASEDLRKLFGQGPVNTDNRPWLEFAAPKLMHYDDPVMAKNLRSQNWLNPETINITQQVTTDIDAQIDFAAYALSLREPFGRMVDLSKTTPSQKERYFGLIETYCANYPVDYFMLQDEQLKRRCRLIQIEAIKNRIDSVPDKAASWFYIGRLYDAMDMLNEAVSAYSMALQGDPRNIDAHNKIGILFFRQGKIREAIMHFNRVLEITDDSVEAHNNLAYIMTSMGELDKAVIHLTEALQLNPNMASTHYGLAKVLVQQGKTDEAVAHFEKAVQLRADWVEAMNDLAWILATRKQAGLRNPTEAIQLAERACELTDYEEPGLLTTLAAAYASVGKFPEAVATAEKVLKLATLPAQKQLREDIQHHLYLYRAGKPYIESSSGLSPD
jgi:spermidine synthase